MWSKSLFESRPEAIRSHIIGFFVDHIDDHDTFSPLRIGGSRNDRFGHKTGFSEDTLDDLRIYLFTA